MVEVFYLYQGKTRVATMVAYSGVDVVLELLTMAGWREVKRDKNKHYMVRGGGKE